MAVDKIYNWNERLPGDLFRAMGTLYLLKKPEAWREWLAKELQDELKELGVNYHVRTLKRQLTGKVATVPAPVQDAMQHVVLRTNGMRTGDDIERALAAAGLAVSHEKRRSEYISTERIVPLVQLWLLLNPSRSRRSLAVELAERLARTGIQIKVDPVQVILAGKKPSARREVLHELQALLSDHGIQSEEEGRLCLEEHRQALAQYEEERDLQSAERLFRLAVAWKVHTREPSSRRLAVTLREKLSRRNIDIGIHRLQEALDGKAKNVRGALVSEMELLTREVLPKGKNLDDALAKATTNKTRLIDLCWVDAKPIVTLAEEWIAQNPGATRHQLSIRVGKTARRMGYATSTNSIQSILGGYKKKTRGFVYRALLKQLPGRGERIPEEHVLPSTWAETALAPFSSRRAMNTVLPSAGGRGSEGLLQGELALPIEPLLSHAEELRIARKVQRSLSRLRGLLPRHPQGYRRFLSRMEAACSGGRPYYPWHRLRGRIQQDLLQAETALRRAEALVAKDPNGSSFVFEEGARTLLRYPLHPETLYHWSREASRTSSPAGPLGELERTKKVVRVLRRVVETLERQRDRLAIANLRLVLSQAFRFPMKGMYQSDLFQEGFLGLHKAVFRFDPERGLRFSTYATHWIRQSIRKALTESSTLIRVPQSAQEKLRRESPELSAQEAERIRRGRREPAFFSSFLADDEDTNFELEDPTASTTETLHIETVPEAVRSALLELSEFERDIVERRFGIGRGEGETLDQIGSQVNLSRERVRQIEAHAIERLRHDRDLKETYEDLSLVEASSVA